MKRTIIQTGKATLVGLAYIMALCGLAACEGPDIEEPKPELDKFNLEQSDYTNYTFDITNPGDINTVVHKVNNDFLNSPRPKFAVIKSDREAIDMNSLALLCDFRYMWCGREEDGIKYLRLYLPIQHYNAFPPVLVKIDWSSFNTRTLNYYYTDEQQYKDQHTTGLNVYSMTFRELDRMESEGFDVNVIDAEMPEYNTPSVGKVR